MTEEHQKDLPNPSEDVCNSVAIFDRDRVPPAARNRACGECSLCCKLLPVPDMQKAGGTRCPHQRITGCRGYANRPRSCADYSCLWLTGDSGEMRRPDKTHYCISIVPDYVQVAPGEDGAETVPVLEIWTDPAHPGAHRDPVLRAYLLRRANDGIAGLVRLSSSSGLLLVPPPWNKTGEWLELTGQAGPEHSADDIVKTLGLQVEAEL